MADQPAPDPETVRAAVELARAILPGDIAVQVSPNLNFESWPSLVQAGATDLGGISLDGDSVSPEFDWPSEEDLAAKARTLGYHLQERLPVYQESLAELQPAADRLRQELVGDTVTYIVNRQRQHQQRLRGDLLFLRF